ncbi:MAG TPA: hypothetical protein VK698_12060 [Kofleriaceae bacterium]|nr:hypothetical protein [Kofleriaceae bacterium]
MSKSAPQPHQPHAAAGSVPRIEPRYVPRPARFIRMEEVGDWRLKVYGLAMPGLAARPELVDATMKLAADHLPRPAVTDDRYGVGFVIAHDAMVSSIAIVYWWQGGNELHQRSFVGPKDDPHAMTKIKEQAAGCVFELGIIDFERRAWIDDVLTDARGQDVDRYLSRRFNADV